MPQQSAAIAARSRLGVATRRRDDNAIHNARQDLAAAKIAQFVERTLAEAPPLTNAQRAEIVRLLKAGAAA